MFCPRIIEVEQHNNRRLESGQAININIVPKVAKLTNKEGRNKVKYQVTPERK
jgi:hypothetical protein